MSNASLQIPYEGLTLSTPNSFWGALTANLLAEWGMHTAVVSPGSRSAPLALAFAAHPSLQAIPVLDERSAGFFAVGRARESGRPVALVCTSGTAAANFLPAVIEARYSHVPLLVLTADRPHELRGCHSGQTINQIRLYGDYPVFQAECGYPEITAEATRAQAALLRRSWEAATGREAGPVHLNFPFRDPLAPDPDGVAQKLEFDPSGPKIVAVPSVQKCAAIREVPLAAGGRGLIVAGPANPPDPESYSRGVTALSAALGWPVLADALSPLRNRGEEIPYLISGYDTLLQHPKIEEAWQPERVLQLGSLPTSKRLRTWLQKGAAPTLVLDPSADRRDPLGRPAQYISADVEDATGLAPAARVDMGWLEQWQVAETGFRRRLRAAMEEMNTLFEGKVAHTLALAAPLRSQIFIASSMPVRDAEFFWPVQDRGHRIHSSRGANGIDGTLSTALGMAHGTTRPCFLLTGDLALLHDANGMLLRRHFQGSLTVLLINNGGGAIFENLPVSRFREAFTEFFLTPQQVDFAAWSGAHEVPHVAATDWKSLTALLQNSGAPGIRLIEVRTNPGHDVPFRRKLTRDLASGIFEDSSFSLYSFR